jgi:hypothetical protein
MFRIERQKQGLYLFTPVLPMSRTFLLFHGCAIKPQQGHGATKVAFDGNAILTFNFWLFLL